MAKPLLISVKQGRAIDFEKGLQYFLGRFPLCLCTRKTNKSKLQKQILPRMRMSESTEFVMDNIALVLELIAFIRIATDISGAFEIFIWKLISTILKDYNRIDFVTGRYSETSIKDKERSK